MKLAFFLVMALIISGIAPLSIKAQEGDDEGTPLFHPDVRISAVSRVVDGQTRHYITVTSDGTCKFVYASYDEEALEPWPTPEMRNNNNWGEQACVIPWEVIPAEWQSFGFPRDDEKAIGVWLLIQLGGQDWTTAEAVYVAPLFGVSEGYYALVTDKTKIYDETGIRENGSVSAGEELVVTSHNSDGSLVIKRQQGDNDSVGTIRAEDVTNFEFASEMGVSYRRYTTQCIASPVDARPIRPAGYTHRLDFQIEKPEKFTLYFNNNDLDVGETLEAKVVNDEKTKNLVIELGGGWITGDILKKPFWFNKTQWQLVWACTKPN